MPGLVLDNKISDVERLRIQQLLRFENELWQKGCKYIAGVDEAGRGPLAGPVVAAAVVYGTLPTIPMVNDSKKVTKRNREWLFCEITKRAFATSVGIATVEEIDRINIYHASILAMNRAVENLNMQPEHLLVDGNAFKHSEIPFTTIVKGDALSYSIASASILAKVTRDRLMAEYDRGYPMYGFAKHKGYATTQHLDAIEKYGYCELHRRSFNPKRFQLKLDLNENVI